MTSTVPQPKLRKTTQLKQLITTPGQLGFLMEAHNGLSAKIVEEAGFKGIWGSGLSISAAMGVRDSNEASWTQVRPTTHTQTHTAAQRQRRDQLTQGVAITARDYRAFVALALSTSCALTVVPALLRSVCVALCVRRPPAAPSLSGVGGVRVHERQHHHPHPARCGHWIWVSTTHTHDGRWAQASNQRTGTDGACGAERALEFIVTLCACVCFAFVPLCVLC